MAETRQLRGVHHVTAITSDAQRNVDFYAGVLGLRLVKVTVNFDDTGAYHLYYGDDIGHPGTVMTFFAWPGAAGGRLGAGQVAVTSFSIPHGAMGFWADRLRSHGIDFEQPGARFDDEVLAFTDPEGLRLELVAPGKTDERTPRREGGVPAEHAIRGFHAVTLAIEHPDATAELMTDAMGFHGVADRGGRLRLEAPTGAASVVDLVTPPGASRGIVAPGTVHHVAWRTPDDDQQLAWQSDLIARGLGVTPVMDRCYFHSIYFREPGGVLFEIATDPPGFTVDERPEALGSSLKLPPWLEPKRPEIERVLPPLSPPAQDHEPGRR